jgi:hypothetical protein
MIPDCEVWAFEAIPQIYERFLASVSAVGVRYVNLAIAATTGQVTLLQRNEDATCVEFTVNATRLDDVMSLRKMEAGGRDGLFG